MSQIAISNLAWLPTEQDEVARILSHLHLTGIEVAPAQMIAGTQSPNLEQAKQYRSYWNEQGIKIVALQSLLFPHTELTLFPDPEVRQKTLQHLLHVIEIGSTLGAKILVFGSPKNRLLCSIPQVDAWEIAGQFFNQLADRAQELGLLFCIEPNTPAYGCDFLVDTKEGVEFIEYVGHPGLRLHLDTSTLTLNHEDYEAAVQLAFPYLAHYHVSEPFLSPIASGTVDHQILAKTLKTLNYQHWVSIEMKRPETDQLAQVRESLEKVISIYG